MKPPYPPPITHLSFAPPETATCREKSSLLCEGEAVNTLSFAMASVATTPPCSFLDSERAPAEEA